MARWRSSGRWSRGAPPRTSESGYRWSVEVAASSDSSPVLPGGHVFLLLGGHLVEGDPEGRQLEPGDLRVDRLGHDVDLRRELGMVLDDVLGRERLVGEAHVHDRGRVTLGGAEIDEPALGDEVDLLAA